MHDTPTMRKIVSRAKLSAENANLRSLHLSALLVTRVPLEDLAWAGEVTRFLRFNDYAIGLLLTSFDPENLEFVQEQESVDHVQQEANLARADDPVTEVVEDLRVKSIELCTQLESLNASRVKEIHDLHRSGLRAPEYTIHDFQNLTDDILRLRRKLEDLLSVD